VTPELPPEPELHVAYVNDKLVGVAPLQNALADVIEEELLGTYTLTANAFVQAEARNRRIKTDINLTCFILLFFTFLFL
jgi:hypothetical protein